MRQIKIGKKYMHFKGKEYMTIAIATHSETKERYVVYQALYGEREMYIRPYEMFASKVDRNKYPEAVQEFRFEEVI